MNSNEILNKYIDLIDKGYCSDCNELNCIDNFPHAKITHAIRELQQENQELKKQLEGKNNPQIFIDTQDMEERYGEQLYQDYLEEENKKYKNQQKEFIEYMNKTIEQVRKNETKLINEIKVLEQQCKKQKEVIDKAVEYIKNKGGYCEEYKMTSKPFNTIELDNLLQILEDKEASK